MWRPHSGINQGEWFVGLRELPGIARAILPNVRRDRPGRRSLGENIALTSWLHSVSLAARLARLGFPTRGSSRRIENTRSPCGQA